jgi:hypothetical protein
MYIAHICMSIAILKVTAEIGSSFPKPSTNINSDYPRPSKTLVAILQVQISNQWLLSKPTPQISRNCPDPHIVDILVEIYTDCIGRELRFLLCDLDLQI